MTLAERAAAASVDGRVDLDTYMIVEKFRANAGRVLPASRVSELERATLGLDTLTDVRSLMPLCRG